jgi:phosphate/sulfate permease
MIAVALAALAGRLSLAHGAGDARVESCVCVVMAPAQVIAPASRGLNDTPKIVAVFLAAAALGPGQLLSAGAFGLVAVGMVVGSLVGGRKVTRVLAEDVTAISGSIAGIGIHRGALRVDAVS